MLSLALYPGGGGGEHAPIFAGLHPSMMAQ